MQLQKLNAAKLDLTPYYDLINSLGSKGKEVFNSGVSYDIEAIVNLKQRNSPINVVEEGYFNPNLSIEENLENTKFYKPNRDYNYRQILEDEKRLPESERFYTNRQQALKSAGVDVTKPVSQMGPGDTRPRMFGTSLKEVSEGLNNSPNNVGIYNLRFEGEALLQQLGKRTDAGTKSGREYIQSSLKDLFYVAPENVSPSAGIYKQYGYITGNNESIGRAQLQAESSFSKFRNSYFADKTGDAYVQSLDKARYDAINLGKVTAEEITKSGRTKGVLYDQQLIAKAFLAKMQETQGISKMGVDWNLGSSIDLLLRSAVDTKELHISTLDAAAAQTLTSHMAGVLQGDAPSPAMVSLVDNFAANQSKYRKEKLSSDIFNFISDNNPKQNSNMFRSMEGPAIEKNYNLYRGDGTVIDSATSYRPNYSGGISREQLLSLRGLSETEIHASVGQTVRKSFENQSFILPNEVEDLTQSAISSIYSHINKGEVGAESVAHNRSFMEGANSLIERLGTKNVAIGIATLGTAALVARQVLMGMKTGRTEDSTHSGFEAMNPGSPDFMGAKTPFNPESMKLIREIFHSTRPKYLSESSQYLSLNNPSRNILDDLGGHEIDAFNTWIKDATTQVRSKFKLLGAGDDNLVFDIGGDAVLKIPRDANSLLVQSTDGNSLAHIYKEVEKAAGAEKASMVFPRTESLGDSYPAFISERATGVASELPEDIATSIFKRFNAQDQLGSIGITDSKLANLGYVVRDGVPQSLHLDPMIGMFGSAKQVGESLSDKTLAELSHNPMAGIRTGEPRPNDAIKPGRPDHQAGRTPFNPDSMAIAGSLLGLGGLTAALLYGRHINHFIFPTSQVWGRASKFGVAGENMWSGVAEEYDEDMSANSTAIVTHGTYLHEEYQKKFLNLFPDAMDEYAVIDYENRMTGHIDLVAPIEVRPGKGPIPIPIEIKTINSNAFSSLKGPKPEHIAQSQFYLHYLTKKYKKDIPYEMFVYINRDNPEQYKVFHENRDEKAFQFYLKRYRSYQRAAADRNLTPQKLTSNMSILKEIAEQTSSRRRLENSSGSDVTTTMNVIQSAAEGYGGKGFGINRSSSTALDFDSPHKKVWAAPSAKLAKEFVNNTSPKIRALTTRPPSSILKMSGYNGRSKLGQQAKYGGSRMRSRAVNQSRAGV